MGKKKSNKTVNKSNNKKSLSEKPYITIQYTPMGLGLGLVTGIIAGQEVNFLLAGLFIGGGIDYLTSMYKKRQFLENNK